MKISFFKITLFLSALIVLVSIFGSVYVKAQEQKGACDEVAGHTADPATPCEDVAIPSAQSAKLEFFTVAGTGFIPYTDTITWTYGGNGCIIPSSSGYWRASVNIPDGSVIKYMYFGYYNTASSTASSAYLYSYGYTGTAVELAGLNSSPGSTTGAGYYYVGGAATDNYTINNLNNAYVFSWSGSTTQELCYMQVGYIIPSTTSTSSTSSSTTTTAPASTTTTTADTTTTTTIKRCPFSKTLGDDEQSIEQLEAFRDNTLAKSAIGRNVIQIYYNNADSINAALDGSPALRTFTKWVLETIAPLVGRDNSF